MTDSVVDIEAYRCPAERPTGTALLLFGALGLLLFTVGTLGFGLLLLLFVLLAEYVTLRLMRAQWLAHGARVDAEHFPHLHEAVEDVRGRLGYREPLEVYVVEATWVNAFISSLLGTRFMVLFSQIVEGAEDDPNQLRALVGHEMAHVAAGHFHLRFVKLMGGWVPLLWSAWSRACEYTADSVAYACTGDLEATERLLATLSVGWRLARHVRPQKMIEQANEASASLAARYLELTSSHPLLVKRIRALRALAAPAEARIAPEPAGLTLAAGALAIPGSYAGGAGGLAGLVTAVAVVAILAAILFPVFGKARGKARDATCLSNEKQIGLAIIMYAQDYDQYLPPHSEWRTRLDPYLKTTVVYRCPAAPQLDCGYAYDPRVSDQRPLAAFGNPAATLCVWDAEAMAAGQTMPTPAFRHQGGLNALYLDGHVHWLSRPTFEQPPPPEAFSGPTPPPPPAPASAP